MAGSYAATFFAFNGAFVTLGTEIRVPRNWWRQRGPSFRSASRTMVVKVFTERMVAHAPQKSAWNMDTIRFVFWQNESVNRTRDAAANVYFFGDEFYARCTGHLPVRVAIRNSRYGIYL